ncbi:MAG: hypothetical protein ACRDBM_01605, partial [Sporomusa sp.]
MAAKATIQGTLKVTAKMKAKASACDIDATKISLMFEAVEEPPIVDEKTVPAPVKSVDKTPNAASLLIAEQINAINV